MAKTKDGFYKQYGSVIGSDDLILLAGGGTTKLSLYAPFSAYSYSNGCLVRTDIPASSNTMATFRIEGNGYGTNSILTTGNFYNYTDGNQILNCNAYHHGLDFGKISVFCYNNYVYMWFKLTGNYLSFIITVYSTYGNPINVNRVTSITNAAIPSSGVTRKVDINPVVGGISTNGIFYIEGTQTASGTGTGTNGKWFGTHTGIKNYYKGLTIAYKIPIAGANPTKLNINSLGEIECKLNTDNLTTHYGVGTVVILVYDGTNFRTADYNTDAYVDCYCPTGAGTAAKVATSTGYKLRTHNVFICTIYYTNTYAGKITLNINSTGAKDIYLNGSVTSSSNYNLEAGKYLVYYDGTNYYFYSNGVRLSNVYGSKFITLGGTSSLFVKGDGTLDNNAYVTQVKVGSTSYSPSSGVVSLPAYPTLSGLSGVGTINASGTAPLTLSASKSGTTVTITGSISEGTTSAVGVVKQYKAADCTSYTSDEGATTPAAVKKAIGTFVTVTPNLTSGTKVGSISVNGTSTDLYCQTNTNWITRIYAGASGTATNTNTVNPYIKITDNNTYRNQIRLLGSIGTTINSDTSGNVTISSNIPLIQGTGTTAGTWLGTTNIAALTDGLTIRYWVNIAGANTTTLNLTLADGSTTGAKTIYRYGTTKLTTHYSVNSVLTLTYRTDVSGVEGWWVSGDYNANNYDRMLMPYLSFIAGTNGAKMYSIIMEDSEGKWLSFTTTSGTAVGKPINSSAKFNLSSGCFLYYGSANIASSGTVPPWSIYNIYPLADIRYSTNWVSTNSITGMTAKKMVYIVGNIDSSGYFVLSNPWYTQTPSDTNKVYLPIGYAYDTYQINFDNRYKPLCLKNGILVDYVLSSNGDGMPFIVGTLTAATGSWTGTSNLQSLYDGLTIKYWLPVAGSGSATLNLTLADGSTTGAINCYYGGTTRLTTHYGAGNLIILTYRENVVIGGNSYTGWWAHSNYNTDDYYSQMLAYTKLPVGTNGVKNASLFMEDSNGNYLSFTTTDGYGTSKAKNTAGFKLGSKIYRNTGGNVASGGTIAEWTIKSASLTDFRYSSNCGTTLTANKMVYLVGTVTNGLFYLADTWWTQTPTDITKVYIPLGHARYTGGYQIDFDNVYTPKVYNGSTLVDYAYQSTKISNYYSSRPTSISPGVTGDGSMFHFKCTSSVTDTTTDPGDSHILHFNWDNTGGYDFQIAGLTSQSTMKIRGMENGTWKSWATVLTNVNSSVSGGGSGWGSSITVNINGTSKTLTIPSNPNTDTKNTAGSTNTSSKIFLIGATSQAANPQTYSHDTAYVGTDGCLYSNSTKVSVNGHNHYHIAVSDTRSVNNGPYNSAYNLGAVSWHLKQNSTIGVTGESTYSGMLMLSPWGNISGGAEHHLAFGTNGGIYHRYGASTMSTWSKLAYKSDIPTKTSQLTNDSGFITSRGYLGTTAIQASSAAQAVAGITTLNMSNTLTITGGGMKVTGAAYFGGGTTYYFGSTGNVNCNTLTAASTTILKGSFLLWNSTNSYISFYNNGKTSSNLVAQIHGMAGYNTTSATYTSGTNMYFRIFSSTANGTTISTAGYYDYVFPNVPQGLTARTMHTIFTTQQSDYTLNETGGATGNVSLTFWRGTNASWKIINTSGNLKFQNNYTSTVTSYFDCLTLAYNTGNAIFKGSVKTPTVIVTNSIGNLDNYYTFSTINTTISFSKSTASGYTSSNRLYYRGTYYSGISGPAYVTYDVTIKLAAAAAYNSDTYTVQIGTGGSDNLFEGKTYTQADIPVNTLKTIKVSHWMSTTRTLLSIIWNLYFTKYDSITATVSNIKILQFPAGHVALINTDASNGSALQGYVYTYPKIGKCIYNNGSLYQVIHGGYGIRIAADRILKFSNFVWSNL